MTNISILSVVSMLALASAQTSGVPRPKRIRGNDAAMKTASNEGAAFGRNTSYLRSNSDKERTLTEMRLISAELSLSMYLSMLTLTTSEDDPINADEERKLAELHLISAELSLSMDLSMTKPEDDRNKHDMFIDLSAPAMISEAPADNADEPVSPTPAAEEEAEEEVSGQAEEEVEGGVGEVEEEIQVDIGEEVEIDFDEEVEEEVATCEDSSDCGEGGHCSCRFSCLFCPLLDMPGLYRDFFCGRCV